LRGGAAAANSASAACRKLDLARARVRLGSNAIWALALAVFSGLRGK